jgi:anti-sigma B factor antagonist
VSLPAPSSPTSIPTATVILLAFTGDLDAPITPLLTAQIDDAVDLAPTSLVIDLSQVDFIDSSALGVLIHAHNLCEAYSITLILRSPSPRVQRLLELSGTLILFTIDDETPAIGQLL